MLLNFGSLLESSERKYQILLGNEWREVDGFNIFRRKSCPPDLAAKIGGLNTISNVKTYDVPFSLRENHHKTRRSILWKMEIGKAFIKVLG